MEILTKEEKKEARRLARIERSKRMANRIEELREAGYGLYDAKSIVAMEMGLTVQVIYSELRWMKTQNV